MDTGPAPHRTLSSSQRFAVSTFHRSSGEAKLIRAFRSGLPERQVWAKPAIVSAAERTSRVTVFTVPPRNVTLEVREQCFWSSEGVPVLLPAVVTVISLSCFVVVSDDAKSIDDIGQSVFVFVLRAFDGSRNSPQNQFSERILRIDDACMEKPDRLHVGNSDNSPVCCQLRQRCRSGNKWIQIRIFSCFDPILRIMVATSNAPSGSPARVSARCLRENRNRNPCRPAKHAARRSCRTRADTFSRPASTPPCVSPFHRR